MVVVLGNINNHGEMKELGADSRLDLFCNAVLKGIVAGADEKEYAASNSRRTLNMLLGDQGVNKCR